MWIGAIIQSVQKSGNKDRMLPSPTKGPQHKSFPKKSEADSLPNLRIGSTPEPCDSERRFKSGLELGQEASERLKLMELLLHQTLLCPFYSAD